MSDAQDRLSPDEVAKAARGFLASNRLDEASRVLRDALAHDPTHAGLLTVASRLALREANLSLALSYAHAAVEHDPADTGAKFALAEAAFQAEDWPLAETMLHAILAAAPEEPVALRRLSDIAAKRGDLAGAIDLARRVLSAQANAANFLHLSGLLMQHGDYADAENVINEGTAKIPGNASLQRRLSELLARRGDVTGAIEAAERWIAERPDDIGGYAHLYALHMKNNDLPAADTVVRAALEREPANLSFIQRASVIAARQGRYQDMFAMAEKLHHAQLDPRQLGHVVATHLQFGNLHAASDALKAARQAIQGDASLFRQSADVAARQGDYKSAIAYGEEAIRLRPEDPAAYEELAALHTQLGDLSSARAVIADGLRQVPDHPGLTRRLAYLDALPPAAIPQPKVQAQPQLQPPAPAAPQPEREKPRGLFGRLKGRS
jgi:tetratricopeptide (TPR) repeat protein